MGNRECHYIQLMVYITKASPVPVPLVSFNSVLNTVGKATDLSVTVLPDVISLWSTHHFLVCSAYCTLRLHKVEG
jgi:hypothetical protein